MPKVKILNLIFKKRYKGVNITFRKWIKEKREEILLNDNAAKSFGYKNKEELINALFDTRAMDYAKGDNSRPGKHVNWNWIRHANRHGDG